MAKYIASINIMPLKDLLDPQGKAVNTSLHNLGLTHIEDVRIGKHITLTIEARTSEEAAEYTNDACKRLLANHVMESYEYTVSMV